MAHRKICLERELSAFLRLADADDASELVIEEFLRAELWREIMKYAERKIDLGS